MIPVSLDTAVAWSLCGALAILTGLWWIDGSRHGIRSVSHAERSLWHCVICAHVYVDSQHVSLSRCPQCESLNDEPLQGQSARIEPEQTTQQAVLSETGREDT